MNRFYKRILPAAGILVVAVSLLITYAQVSAKGAYARHLEFALLKDEAIGNWTKFRGQFGFHD